METAEPEQGTRELGQVQEVSRVLVVAHQRRAGKRFSPVAGSNFSSPRRRMWGT
jgi:hypothetical protein